MSDSPRPPAREWLASAGLACLYLVFCLAVQASTGAWKGGFAAYPDEPSHFVGAAMLRDWIGSFHWTSPFRFAQDYYAHYPFMALGYWPPMFSVVGGVWFLIAGVGRMQAVVVPAAFAAGTGWLVFRILRPRAGFALAACAGAVFLGLPVSQRWFCAVMVDHMTSCLCLASAVALLAYLEQPDYFHGALLAGIGACAILTKYSAGFLVVLPWATCLLLGRIGWFRKPSLLLQPILMGLLIGPWVLWTRKLAFYGLPAQRPSLTPARAASFLGGSFNTLPVPVLVFVILGLIALMLLRTAWAADVAVLGILCAGHLAFLILSPVEAEGRDLLLEAACLIVFAFAGWAAALSLARRHSRFGGAARVSLAALAMLCVSAYFGRYPIPRQYRIRSVVARVLAGGLSDGQRVVVPADLEGPFIAEFVAQESTRPRAYLLRPSKILASMDWFGGRYRSLFSTRQALCNYFVQNPVRFVVWHDQPERLLRPHERLLHDMLRDDTQQWYKVAAVAGTAGTGSWSIYAQRPEQSVR